jgi:hypothetical protein
MKNSWFILLVAAIVIFGCKGKGSLGGGDFNGLKWNDTFEKVAEKEKPLEGTQYDMDGTSELIFEGSFLGVTTNYEEEDVARLTYHFTNNQLKGGWFYIFANYELFNPKKYIEETVKAYGNPSVEWIEEDDAETKLWLTSRSAIKIVVKDFGDKYRFEWYVYELEWFNEHKHELGLPE